MGKFITARPCIGALRLKGCSLYQRFGALPPRLSCRSRTSQSNRRRAMEVMHIYWGQVVWVHLTAVLDWHDCEITDYEFAFGGGAQEVERAIEVACLTRFGTLPSVGGTPVVLSDNGLIFQKWRFRRVCLDSHLSQEFIISYAPQQNGLIERFFRCLTEECVWQHQFGSLKEARKIINLGCNATNHDHIKP